MIVAGSIAAVHVSGAGQLGQVSGLSLGNPERERMSDLANASIPADWDGAESLCRRLLGELGRRREGFFEFRDQLVDSKRLEEDRHAAGLAGFDQGVRRVVAVAGHQDDWQVAVDLTELLEDLVAVAVGKPDVGDDSVVVSRPGQQEALFGVVSCLDIAAEAAQQLVSRFADFVFGVDHQHPFVLHLRANARFD